MTLGLFLFLVVFYLVPFGAAPLSEWVWRNAPAQLPSLMVVRGGRPLFNGAFYAAALAAWALCLAGGAVATGGWSRPPLPLRILTRLIGLCALGLVAACLYGGRPVHGPLSLALAVFLTGLLPGGRRASRPSAISKNVSDGDTPSPIPLSSDARPLAPSEPPPLAPEAVAEATRRALMGSRR